MRVRFLPGGHDLKNCALSSVVEHLVYTERAGGSIPSARTKLGTCSERTKIIAYSESLPPEEKFFQVISKIVKALDVSIEDLIK